MARPDDAPEHYELYAIPVAATIGGYGLSLAAGGPNVGPAVAMASGVLCIGGIAGYAHHVNYTSCVVEVI